MSDIITINGHTCRVMRLSFIGELGYELHIPFASCIPIYNKIADVGKSFGMRLAGYRSLYALSCEKGSIVFKLSILFIKVYKMQAIIYGITT